MTDSPAAPTQTAGPVAINMVGQSLAHWTVLRQAWSRRSRAHWICVCECGAQRTIGGTDLRSMARRQPILCTACGRGNRDADVAKP